MLEKTFYKKMLSKAFDIPVKVTYWDNETAIYGAKGSENPQISLKINKAIPIKEITDHATLALGEAYINGVIEIEGSLQDLVLSIYHSSSSFMHDNKFMKLLPKQKHTESKSKVDVQSHYDIGNDFYKLWLDPTMTYSCAYFRNEQDTLEEAQKNKVRHILNKLQPQAGKTLLDIGCGWGTVLFAAAKKYGLTATGITLSQEQYDYVKKRIANEHLENQVKVLLIDYRELKNQQFDYVVSVGMFEHVGKENLGTYFKQIHELLAPDGRGLIHGITGQHKGAGVDPFLNKYIFPGGYIPNIAEMLEHIIDNQLQISDLEPLRRHYQRTLEIWNKNFNDQREKVVEIFDERFARLWDLYLQACAASFESGNIDVFQYLITKQPSGSELPMTRDYITDADRKE